MILLGQTQRGAERRAMGIGGRIWRVANDIKNAAEWYAILGAALGLPTVAVALAISKGAELDVVLLYLCFAIAYGLIVVKEGGPLLMKWIERRKARYHPLKIVFDRDCSGCRYREGAAGTSAPVFRLSLGIANRGRIPADAVTVYVTLAPPNTYPPAPLRRLEHAGWHTGVVPQPPVDPVTVNPSGPSHDHFLLVSYRRGNMHADFFAGGQPTPLSVIAPDLQGDIVVSNKIAPVSARFVLGEDAAGLPEIVLT